MSDDFLEVVAQNAKLAEKSYRYRSIEILADLAVEAAKAGRDLPWDRAAEPENLHLLAAVSSALNERMDLTDEPHAEVLARVKAMIEAIDAAVAGKLVEVRKVEYTHSNGWRIELDCDQVHPDDPGMGTPAEVHTAKGSTSTFHCAWQMGEVEYEEVPDGVSAWLEHFLPLLHIVETRTHPSHRN